MNNQNKAQKQMIVDIKDIFFEIPPYQRLYEWEKDEIETLLDDMKKACDLDKEKAYFIGNITTSIKNNKGEYDKTNDKQDKIYVLIDGQQRLTTLWFIGFYLASMEYEWEKEITKRVWQDFILQNDKLRISMPIRDNEEKALKELAMKIHTIKPNENGEINLYAYLPSDIHQKVINAFECIEKWFNARFGKYINGKLEIDDLKQLKCFSLFIYKRVCFVFVELAQNTDLNRFFVRMNNRGKQLEKHEILKARILDKIRDDKSDEWQKYGKIWDLCSDMNKYIFQSASDRKVLNSENEGSEKWGIDKIISGFDDKNTKGIQDGDTPDKVESIIDFPTFLLHCYKLWVAKKCNDKIEKITITKDKLLEIMWDAKEDKNRHNYLFVKRDKHDCKDFIIDMLYYRVLFDYFVIKDDVRARSSNNYKIMRLNESKDNYSLPENSKKGELTSGVLHDLVMIQNYLRVARQGDRQNYHHWLTPFLKFLDNHIYLEMDLSLMKNCAFDFTNFKCGAKKIAEQFSKDECDERQKVLVRFLENLDTKLAIKQLSKPNENVLLNTTNTILININEHLNFQEEKSKIEQISKWREKYKNIFFHKKCFLNNGTGTPHYWFYRLEYYLWKNSVENEKILNIKDKNFSEIRKNFYFRNLGSIEHFQPQSEPDEKWWLNDKSEMDTFGNLALISRSLNSSLGKQNLDKKEIDIAKEGNSESLKLVLMCCLKNLKNNDIKANEEISKAQAHQKLMIDILIKSLKNSQEK